MATNEDKNNLDELSINTIRFLAVDAVEKANSGHPGMPMGDAPMAYVLWKKFLKHDPKDPTWPGRDRFVLSAGHGSMLLYSFLHLTGYDISLDDLKDFRQWESKTAGHPEYEPSLGIETTTGPLGQGFATGIGMAMAAKRMGELYNRPGYPLFDYNIYAITSDGDIMEGVSSEAASIAGHLKLGNIIYLYSDNKITIEGGTDLSFSEDVEAKYAALGWHIEKTDGNDLDAIEKAIKRGQAEKERPTLIIARTNIGFGSPNKQDTSGVHGAPLGADEVKLAKEALDWPLEPTFHIPEVVLAGFREALSSGAELTSEWKAMTDKYAAEHQKAFKELSSLTRDNRGGAYLDALPEFAVSDGPIATRSVSGKVLNAIAGSAPFLIGGSADLGPSNNTELKGLDAFGPGRTGRNIHFGIREHAMGSIMNGMALSGYFLPYGGTFLVFSDYMRPAIRLAALMGLQVAYVFTHDSIGLGEDGPTHQPIEHIASLRAMPGLTVIRPADAVETVSAWREALTGSGPVVLALTRQKLPIIDRGHYADTLIGSPERGGYVIADTAEDNADLIIIATGSEVHIALEAAEELKGKGIGARVVSMPSFEIFDAQDDGYRDEILPSDIEARISIEAATTFGWGRYVGVNGVSIGIDSFGASAPAKTLYEKFGITAEAVVTAATELAAKKKATC